MNRFSYTFRELLPDTDALTSVMGYGQNDAPEPVVDLIREISEELVTFNDVRAEYRIFSNIILNAEKRSIALENVEFMIGKIIYHQIKNAEGAALFICTAGPAVEEMSRKCMKEGDLLKGYVYDVIASEVVENAAGKIQEEIRQEAAKEEKFITNRFSPGYCGWDVAEQHKLFSFFKENFCGITLTESALMYPVKSVSGIIGTGRDVKFAPYQCRLCDDKNCIYRNRKNKK